MEWLGLGSVVGGYILRLYSDNTVLESLGTALYVGGWLVLALFFAGTPLRTAMTFAVALGLIVASLWWLRDR